MRRILRRVPIAADPARFLYFFAVAAFLAGFSERFAQDMLAAGGSRFKTAEESAAAPPRGEARR